MNEAVWHKIFEDYLDSYYSIHKLFKNNLIDEDEKSSLLSKWADDVATTFDSEINS